MPWDSDAQSSLGIMALGFLEPSRDHLSLSTTGGLIYFKYRDADIWDFIQTEGRKDQLGRKEAKY